METWHVYQLHSDTELLYVGYTRWLKRRLRDHRREKPWWPEVIEVRSEEFATEDEARQREKELWVDGRPKYNKNSPFRTVEEQAVYMRANVKRWRREHPEQFRKYEQNRMATPEYREARLAYQREWRKRGRRPTTVAGRRAVRWQQSGPGLFD